MPKLREPTVSRIPVATEVARPPPPDTRFKPGHERKGGRAPGTPNHFSLNTREAIVIALNNLGGGGQDGLINWIEGAVKEDTSFGIKLLTAIVPRQADIHVTRTAPEVRTIEDLDRSLIAAECIGTIAGFGPHGYHLAFAALVERHGANPR